METGSSLRPPNPFSVINTTTTNSLPNVVMMVVVDGDGGWRRWMACGWRARGRGVSVLGLLTELTLLPSRTRSTKVKKGCVGGWGSRPYPCTTLIDVSAEPRPTHNHHHFPPLTNGRQTDGILPRSGTSGSTLHYLTPQRHSAVAAAGASGHSPHPAIFPSSVLSQGRGRMGAFTQLHSGHLSSSSTCRAALPRPAQLTLHNLELARQAARCELTCRWPHTREAYLPHRSAQAEWSG